jgi:hypothetical protein
VALTATQRHRNYFSQGRLRWSVLVLFALLSALHPAAFAADTGARAPECAVFEGEGAERLVDDMPVLAPLPDAIAMVCVSAGTCANSFLKVLPSGHPARDAFQSRAPPA